MKKKKTPAICDDDLEKILKEKLAEDPFYWLDLIKRGIDELPYTCDEKWMLSLKSSPLIPSVTYTSAKRSYLATLPIARLREISRGEGQKAEALVPAEIYNCTISPESVDTLFYPWTRRLIKEWQEQMYDERKPKDVRSKAEKNIKRIGELLTKQRRGVKKSITPEIKEQIEQDFNSVERRCKKIFEKAKQGANRRLLIREEFPDVAEDIFKNHPVISSPKFLRNLILSCRYKVSQRVIEEALRDYLDTRRFIKKTRNQKARERKIL